MPFLYDYSDAVSDSGGKPKKLRIANNQLVLSAFSSMQEMTVSDVASVVPLSKTTLMKIVDSFLQKGLLLPTGKASSSSEGGKKANTYIFNSSHSHALCLMYSEAWIKYALVNMGIEIIDQGYLELPVYNPSYGDFVDTLSSLINKVIDKNSLGVSKPLSGVIIAANGIINPELGIIRYTSCNNGWPADVPIAADVAAKIHLNTLVLVDNACRFAGFYELQNSKGLSANGQCIVTLHTVDSTGGCIIRNHSLLYGNNGYIGEIGHVPLKKGIGLSCEICGGEGCFQELVRPSHILNMVRKRCPKYPDSTLCSFGASLTLQDIFCAARSNDSLALYVMDDIADSYAQLISILLPLHDPDVIVIQGTYFEASDILLDRIKQKLDSPPHYIDGTRTVIYFSSLGGDDVISKGAASFLFDHLHHSEAFYQ